MNEDLHVYGSEDEKRDDRGVQSFARAMREKLAKKRAEGRGSWWDVNECSAGHLSSLLLDHLEKGDPVDIGNFAMMLFNRPEKGALATEFQSWLKKAVGFHPSYLAVVKELEELRKARATREARASADAFEAEKTVAALRGELLKLQQDREQLQRAYIFAEQNLARALGYIDRVNEGTTLSGPLHVDAE